MNRLLDLGYRVRVIDNMSSGHYRRLHLQNPGYEFIYGDLNSDAHCEDAVRDVRTIFHLAMPPRMISSETDLDTMWRYTLNNSRMHTSKNAHF